MKNYNTLNEKLKCEMITFINKLSTGLGKVDTHFITDMVNGIISNNSVILSDIARTMNERPNIKKSVERLERYVYLNGDKTTIRNIAMKCKGFYKLDVNYRGNNHKLKVTAKTIKIKNKETKDLENNLLTLIIIKGFSINNNKLTEAYMSLITSRKVSSKNDVLQVVRDYLLRWRIEENFRFKKQQFNLKNIRIRKYNRLQAMYKLLSMIMIFNNIINIKAIGKIVRKIQKQIREKIIFWLYRISDGIKEVISFFSDELIKLIYPKLSKRRRDLFTVMGLAFR